MSLDIMLTVPAVDGGERYAWEGNITHNLKKMAEAADLAGFMWSINVDETAINLIVPLSVGLETLKADPSKFMQFAAPNGWGTFEDLCRFVTEFRDACARFPAARVSTSV